VLRRLKQYHVKVKLNKFSFFMESVKYFNHVIDAARLHPTEERMKDIINAHAPENVTEVKAYPLMITRNLFQTWSHISNLCVSWLRETVDMTRM
jgi:hypothetical protein